MAPSSYIKREWVTTKGDLASPLCAVGCQPRTKLGERSTIGQTKRVYNHIRKVAKGNRLTLDCEMIGIPVGAELRFFRDEIVRCLVWRQSSPHALFRGWQLTVNATRRDAYIFGESFG